MKLRELSIQEMGEAMMRASAIHEGEAAPWVEAFVAEMGAPGSELFTALVHACTQFAEGEATLKQILYAMAAAGYRQGYAAGPANEGELP